MSVTGAVMVPHPPIIVHEIGKGEENKINETVKAYEAAADMIEELDPDTVVISSPHNVMYADYFNIASGDSEQGSLNRFNADEVKFDLRYDVEFVQTLSYEAAKRDFPAGTLGGKPLDEDHGTMVPMYFLNKAYASHGRKPVFRTVRIGLSGLSLADHYRLGMMIQKTADVLGRNVVYIASGDLSHRMKEEGPYGYDEAGPVYDKKIMDVMGRGAFDELFDFNPSLCESAAECGHRSFVMMAGALDRMEVKVERLSHQDTFGVGYGVCLYEVKGTDENRNFLDKWQSRERGRLSRLRNEEDLYISLARKTVETFINTGKVLDVPDDLPAEMTGHRAGVFVSIHEGGALRGCIGTISAVRGSVAEEIIGNAISAASRDPRFTAVRKDELPLLEYSVDVLGVIESIDSPDQLDVHKYGVIVSKGDRRGLLLPNLDGVDKVEDQIAIARRKADIGLSEQGVKLERFQVVRHEC